jgi:protease-4
MSSRRGVLALVLAAVLLGFVVLVIALNLRRPAAALPSAPAVLIFDVPETLSEGPPPARSFLLGPRRSGRTTTYDVLRALRRAANDDQVSGLVLHVGSLDWGWAKIGEVRDAVARFRQAGKPVYASITGGGDREYLLASVAGTVAMPPTAVLQLDGLVATATYFRGAFDKFGVSPNFAHVGRFKSGVEPYMRTGMSPEARADLGTLLDGLYGALLEAWAARAICHAIQWAGWWTRVRSRPWRPGSAVCSTLSSTTPRWIRSRCAAVAGGCPA